MILFGILLAVVGVLLYFGKSIPILGKLPGDIQIQRKGVHIYFPLASCLLLSVVLTVILRFLRR